MNALCELYKGSEYKYFINNLDYLLKYEAIQRGFVADVVKIIIERAIDVPEYANSLSLIFNPHTEIHKKLNSVFSGNFKLLESVYMAVDRVDQHADYNGSALTKLLDNDSAFIDRYLEDKISKNDYLSSHDDSRDYSFIWLREDCGNIMQRITSSIIEHESKGHCFGYYESFFNKSMNPQTDSSVLDKQNEFLINEIETEFDNKECMHLLFSVIVGFPLKRKLIFYKVFLDKNKEFDDFSNLPYESTISSWSGSAVPMLQAKIEFYEEVMPLCNSVELLKHRQSIEQRIQKIRNEIQHEKKRDFTESQ